MGGGPANVVVRGELPSSAGHDVVLDIAAPGATVGNSTPGSGTVVDEEVLVELDAEPERVVEPANPANIDARRTNPTSAMTIRCLRFGSCFAGPVTVLWPLSLRCLRRVLVLLPRDFGMIYDATG